MTSYFQDGGHDVRPPLVAAEQELKTGELAVAGPTSHHLNTLMTSTVTLVLILRSQMRTVQTCAFDNNIYTMNLRRPPAVDHTTTSRVTSAWCRPLPASSFRTQINVFECNIQQTPARPLGSQ